jgi:hypothetical protein
MQPRHGCNTSDNRCSEFFDVSVFMVKKVGGLAQIHLRIMMLCVLTPDTFYHSWCYTKCQLGPETVKDAPFKTGVQLCDKYFSL